jgi:amino acid adenylation domain-containing protein
MTTSPNLPEDLSLDQKRELLAELLRKQAAEPNVFPVSFAQERLWFLDQLEPGSVAYNVPVGVRLQMALDVGALRVAVAGLIDRHESLRTRFGVVDGRPVQIVEPTLEIDIPVTDLSGSTGAEREAEAARLAAVEAQRPFDLAAGPLLRAGLLRLAATDWVLQVTMHHIVSDAWSVGVLMRELTELYEAARIGRAPALDELPIQYADFAAWQREWLTGEVLAEQVAYWRERLAGAPAVLELPADHPRPAVQSFAGQSHAFELDQRLLDQLDALARREGATLFMVLLTAFKTLLFRYSDQPDLVVGTPIANRTRAEVEGLIGFFTNTLALRTDASGDPTFTELLGRVRDHTLAAYAHQDLPFERLVEETQPERTLSHNPIFQVMFTLQNAPGTPTSGGGGGDTQSVAGNGTAKFDLSLFAAQSQTGLFCMFEYTTDLFEAARIERMAGHLTTLLEQIAADADRSISQLALLTDPERRRLLEPATPVAYAQDTLVHELFEAHAASDPDHPALLHNGDQISYGELNERANQLAHALQGQGVGPDMPVAVCLDRGPDQLTAMLAVLKAGGAYLPVDPNYPPERVAFMLDDSKAQIVITDPTPAPDQPTTNLTTTTQPDNLAYIIYTSGSTGQPKATTLPHRGLANVVDMQLRSFGLGPADRVLQFASISFDMSVWDIMLALGAGATLCTGDQDSLVPGAPLIELLRENGITVMTLQPVALEALPDEPLEELRLIVVGGEACSPELIARWNRNRRFFNCYGPAEATILSTAAESSNGDVDPTIGCAIQNVEALILDEALQPVPEGIPGELCIGGIGLARGYLNQPALTAQKFVPHPHTTSPGARLYRTGDRARRHHNGTIEFLGRQDNQIKIRGFRIEPGEIETLLTQHPAIRECAVTAREDTPGDRRLTAYLTPTTPTHTTTPDQLRSHLQTKLPAYMIPTNYVWITNLPLTPNGKLDHKKLPAPTPQNPLPHNTYTPPTTPTQTTLTKIWQDVLGINHIGTHDNFFDLGGHSLLATQVTSRIRTTLNYDLPLRQLFEHPTIHTLATTIDGGEQARVSDEPDATPIEHSPRDEPLTLSFSQERLWFLDQLEPGNPLYNVAGGVSLRMPVDVGALRVAVAGLVARHEALRTRFGVVDGRPVQLVEARVEIDVAVTDLSGLAPAERETEAARLAAIEAQRPFDLTAGPLLRVGLLRLAPADWVLLVTTHHIVSDAWSVGILFRELTELYEAGRIGRQPQLPELPIQYADYAAWQRRWLTGSVLDEQLGYWRQRLAGAPAILELPADHPRPAVQSFAGHAHAFELDQRLLDQLNALARGEGATLFMVLLTAFKALLFRYSGQPDLVVGTPIANRTRAEVEGLIGFFTNTLALRTDLSGDPTFTELVGRVRDDTLAAYAHQDLPFERLVEELQPERTLSHNPIFQVMFTLQNAPGTPTAGPGSVRGPGAAAAGTAQLGNGTAKFDLSLLTVETNTGLLCMLEYTTDLFDSARIERMAVALEIVIRRVTADPSVRLSDLVHALDVADETARHDDARAFASARRRQLTHVQQRPGA